MAGYCYQILTNQRRVGVWWVYRVQGARDSPNQSSPPGMQRAVGYKMHCSFVSPIPFNYAVQKRRRIVRERSEELSKNASISSGVTDTSDNFRSCNPGVFDGGTTYRLELQCYHLAGKSERNTNSHNNNNKGLSMSSNAKAVTLLWNPRKMTEGPTRPLVNMNGKKPSEYYLLRSETLQDRAMNAMFNHYGCGYDDLPPSLQRMYHNHIYNYNNE